MNPEAWISLFTAAVRLATPLVFAALGGILAERSGVLNIGLEGMMVAGTFGGYLGGLLLGDPWAGALGGMLAGGLFGFIFAWMAVYLRADQVVLGTGINILGLGLTSYFYRAMYKSGVSQFFPGFKVYPIPGLSEIPILGPVLFQQIPLVYLMYGLAPLTAFVLYRTTWGLKLRAVGEHPQAADTAGISVLRMRLLAVTLSGAFAGLGGAFLSVGQLSAFTEGLVAGRGFIALAAVIFGRWDPLRSTLGCLMFGLADALQLRLQSLGIPAPIEVFLMFPYLLTLVMFILFVSRVRPPASLGKPYDARK
ncbi:MAG: ABC transporter permease [Chloroflexota bacterium]